MTSPRKSHSTISTTLYSLKVTMKACPVSRRKGVMKLTIDGKVLEERVKPDMLLLPILEILIFHREVLFPRSYDNNGGRLLHRNLIS